MFNVFHSCSSYSYFMWHRSKDSRDICPRRAQKVTKDGRFKNIVRVGRTALVQVHHVSYASTLVVDHKKDMVMLHFKMGWHKKPSIPYDLNPVVIEGVKYALCSCLPQTEESNFTRLLRLGSRQHIKR